MARAAFCLFLAVLFLASVIPSEAQKTEAEAAQASGEESLVTVAQGAPLIVECRLRAEQHAEWQRDGAAPPPDLHAAPEAAAAPDARLTARLRAAHARPQHAGVYTCARDRRHRVRVVVKSAPADPGAETTAAPPAPSASVAAPAPGAGPPEMLYNIRYNFALLCPIPNDKNLEYEWKKNETELSLVEGLKGRYKLHLGGANLTVERSTEEDFGNYSCALPGAGEWRWAVRGRPHLKLDPNTNVVEGQKLKLVCKVVGKPYPRVRWAYSNSSEGENFAPLGDGFATADSEAGVPDGVLLLAAAARAHAGRYRCLADDALAPGETTLRVKDMYAALWPFLGICAEVFVLCAIILLYERRRTKPDLDDSDADNNDQKKS